ncbi:MAG: hypothetical protein DCC68_19245 [Planctomycetota bacterium]|nr:MAG: hypothetical protein DCC68_19245 [Planctomycetota bacterium]
MVALFAVGINCGGCQHEKPKSVVRLRGDISASSRRNLGFDFGFGVRKVKFSSTSSDDLEIDRQRLQSIIREASEEKPACISVLAREEGPWVFYLGHSLVDHEVVLELSSDTPITVNGFVYAEPIPLAPGAHGFRITNDAVSTRVEHVSLPLDANESDDPGT